MNVDIIHYPANQIGSPRLVHDTRVNIRRSRRLPSLNPMNQAILTAFVGVSFTAFMVIYLEATRLLIPDTVLSLGELRLLTKGFTNDIPQGHQTRQSHPVQLGLLRQKPSAIVIGFLQCRPGFVLNHLALHPDVIVNRKDLHFFNGNQTEEWYLSRMPLSLSHHKTVDVCLNCISNATALSLIATFNKHIKVIVVTCNTITYQFRSNITSGDFQKNTNGGSKNLKKSSINSNKSLRPNVPTRGKMDFPSLDRKLRDIVDIHQNPKEKKININPNIRVKREMNLDSEIPIFHIKSKSSLKNRSFENNKGGNLDFTLQRDLINPLKAISHVFSIFPEKQVHILEQEKFMTKPKKEIVRLFDYLQVKRISLSQ